MKNLQLFLELASERAQALKDRQDKFKETQAKSTEGSGSGTLDSPETRDKTVSARERYKRGMVEVYDPEMGTVRGPRAKRSTADRRAPGTNPRKKTVRDPNTGKLTRVPSSYDMKKDSSGSTSGQYPKKSITTSKRTELPTVTDPEERKKVKQSYADKVKADRIAAAKARAAARKSGGEVKTTTISSKDVERQADQLLKKKTSEPKSSKPKPKSVPLSRNLDREGNPRERSDIDHERNKKKKDMRNASQKGYKEIYNDMIGKMSNPTNADRIRARVEAKKKAAVINAAQKG